MSHLLFSSPDDQNWDRSRELEHQSSPPGWAGGTKLGEPSPLPSGSPVAEASQDIYAGALVGCAGLIAETNGYPGITFPGSPSPC